MYEVTSEGLSEAYELLDIVEDKMREDCDIAREGECALDYFPNDEEIKYIAEKIETDRDFFYYALALANSERAPKNDAERASRAKLNELLKSVMKVTE
jgi:hypothetical protein